jgi:hypothetical protein
MSDWGNTNEFDGRPELLKARARAIMLERLWRVLWIVIVAIVAALIVADIIIGTRARAELLDCTTPGGECYEKSQEQTGGAVADIVKFSRDASVAAAHCADAPGQQTLAEIRKCTNEIMGLEE